jgi:hypothetical protein
MTVVAKDSKRAKELSGDENGPFLHFCAFLQRTCITATISDVG